MEKVGAMGTVGVPLVSVPLSRDWCDVFPYIYGNGTWMDKWRMRGFPGS